MAECPHYIRAGTCIEADGLPVAYEQCFQPVELECFGQAHPKCWFRLTKRAERLEDIIARAVEYLQPLGWDDNGLMMAGRLDTRRKMALAILKEADNG